MTEKDISCTQETLVLLREEREMISRTTWRSEDVVLCASALKLLWIGQCDACVIDTWIGLGISGLSLCHI